jgi:hypothetical protein
MDPDPKIVDFKSLELDPDLDLRVFEEYGT